MFQHTYVTDSTHIQDKYVELNLDSDSLVNLLPRHSTNRNRKEIKLLHGKDRLLSIYYRAKLSQFCIQREKVLEILLPGPRDNQDVVQVEFRIIP